jgi:hypothetical protein
MTDSYSLGLIRLELQMRLGEVKTTDSHMLKGLSRLGDAVAIALVKVMNLEDLLKPNVVRELLPIIQQAFIDVDIVKEPSDRQPKVTLLLLSHLRQCVPDEDVRAKIRTTIEFVRQQAEQS